MRWSSKPPWAVHVCGHARYKSNLQTLGWTLDTQLSSDSQAAFLLSVWKVDAHCGLCGFSDGMCLVAQVPAETGIRGEYWHSPKDSALCEHLAA